MVDYKILNKKSFIYKDNDQDAYLDLLDQTYVSKNSIKGSLLVVNEYYVSRPDLVSLAIYGDDCFADIICKINGISNPFELNENDILFIPAPDELSELTQRTDKPSDLVQDDNENLVVKTKKDNRKKVSDKRASNEMIFGQSNYIIDRSTGLVFY